MIRAPGWWPPPRDERRWDAALGGDVNAAILVERSIEHHSQILRLGPVREVDLVDAIAPSEDDSEPVDSGEPSGSVGRRGVLRALGPPRGRYEIDHDNADCCGTRPCRSAIAATKQVIQLERSAPP